MDYINNKACTNSFIEFCGKLATVPTTPTAGLHGPSTFNSAIKKRGSTASFWWPPVIVIEEKAFDLVFVSLQGELRLNLRARTPSLCFERR
jgi:hypothetical protein